MVEEVQYRMFLENSINRGNANSIMSYSSFNYISDTGFSLGITRLYELLMERCAPSIYNDSFETSWDGTYRFDYLRKGNYVLYAYSDCDSCPSGKEPVFWEVTIDNNNQLYQISDQVIRK